MAGNRRTMMRLHILQPMKHRVFKLLSCLCLVVCLSACEQENEIEVVTPERTVLVYFAADNNLSSFAMEDLEELKAGIVSSGLSKTQHLLVYVDTGGEAYLSELSYKDGKVVEDIIKTYPDRNSTGVSETKEVFEDVFSDKTYQAETYALVYWSHADGWIPYPVSSTRWIGQDRGDGDNRMNISEFKEVLDAAPHFDFIMFDACFMQSVEVAYELRDYCDYYIASPTENPGPGAPYDKLLPYMFAKGKAKELAAEYFKAYNDLYNGGIGISNSNWTGGVSIGVLETSRLQLLAEATAQALSVANDMSCADLRDDNVFDYDQRSSSHIGYYDLAGMMQQLLGTSDYASWKEIYDTAVAYWNTTPMNYSQYVGMFSMEDANGVTHYVPSSPTAAACEAYHSLAWYEDAGISQLGW